MAGCSNLHMPHLGLTEATIIDSLRQALSQYHRGVDRNSYENSYNNPRQRLQNELPDNPPPYDSFQTKYTNFTATQRNGVPSVNRNEGDYQQNNSDM